MLSRLTALALACAALAAPGALADSSPPVLPADAPPVAVAGQFLLEISELKTKPMLVGCVTVHGEGTPGFLFLGLAFVKGNVMFLSNRYVCQPLAVAWRSSPIFTGQPQKAIPLTSVRAVEVVAHEWFHTRGIASEERAECKAVQYTWKWLRRSSFPKSFLATAKRFLLDNRPRPEGYKVPANCLGPTS